LCRAEYLSKIFGEKLGEAFGRYCSNHPHLIASIIDHQDLRATSSYCRLHLLLT
jgi:hypothetical protein